MWSNRSSFKSKVVREFDTIDTIDYLKVWHWQNRRCPCWRVSHWRSCQDSGYGVNQQLCCLFDLVPLTHLVTSFCTFSRALMCWCSWGAQTGAEQALKYFYKADNVKGNSTKGNILQKKKYTCYCTLECMQLLCSYIFYTLWMENSRNFKTWHHRKCRNGGRSSLGCIIWMR